jgi:ABC-type branched-subunit amino acid transport system substrate-binding protein
MIRRFPRRQCLALLLAATGTLLTVNAAGATNSAAKRPSGEPLVFGYPDGSPTGEIAGLHAGLQAYFDNWNHRGGYRGRPVKLVYDYVGLNPGTNQAAIAREAESDKVTAFLQVAFCQVNKQQFAQLKIMAFNQGDATCYDKSYMAAMSGQAPTLPMLKWAIDQGVKKFAIMYPAGLGFEPYVLDPLTKYLENNPSIATELLIEKVPLSATAADVDLAIADMKAKGVEAVIPVVQLDSDVLIREASTNGFGPKDGIKWIFSPNGYTPAAAALPELDGTFVMSQWYAWEDTANPAVKKALARIGKKVDVLDGFVGTGYLVGAVLEQGLKNVKGPITRDTVRDTFLSLHHFKMPFAPYTIDIGELTANPSGGQILEAKNGHWVKAGAYTVVPAKEFT